VGTSQRTAEIASFQNAFTWAVSKKMAIANSETTGIPVNDCIARTFWGPRIRGDMKNLKRLILGALSSLLLAVGFARAADQLDPMSRSLPHVSADSSVESSPDCATLCDIV
jgi:hypothetical protein